MSKRTAPPSRGRKQAAQTTTAHRHKLAISATIAAALVAVGLVWLLTSVVFSDDGETTAPKEEATPSATVSPALPLKPGKNVPSGSQDENKKLVLTQATSLLREGVKVGGSEENYQTLLEALQAGNFSLLPPQFTAPFRFSDYLATEDLQAASYISVVHLSTLVNQAAEAQEKAAIEPLTTDAWENVFVDMEAGQAFVPITVYLGSEASFSLEFVYVGGEWKFTPYSLIDAIQAAERSSQNPQ